ncbi:Tyrosine--tRNA ligase [bioreactor metagenome]|jgi:tyrosyl-tRNA synthetase|uniref:tyrosine--tRNA ligase n=1 Tax=bioreactor metagenome TaxID=1076179 RepID=A0A644U352_9ZZZZ|nr:tyrosine--tRNA ligase [Bacteroidales bacterium]MDD3286299.1 tyrosine--tRNA ligase [Bacteroidales bacterium]MEA4967462.1 tyrosine--tRNA ligase [Bacteroidaceae bacterium]MEA5100353.1 tyrosine--tRNA ligase [Bacteroidales bacterium]NCC17350.1 tyrosine--tRNA ligase [Bacteroidia bacterium]
MDNFIKELEWRGMIHNVMPGTEELLMKEMTTAYVGIDPTADSLHIGHLVGVMMLTHLQRCGHRPLVVLGGATGMIGDPSFKSEERKLLTIEQIEYNKSCIENQLSKFMDFKSDAPNKAEVLNNYDWTKGWSFLDFIRDIGKHITVNYMMAKDSVKKRLETGLSFTEFSYQLLQGYDFKFLYENYNCRLQMGGSDQWGNITTGTELIRRMLQGEAYALTCPLITKADGGKFGKTEKGNIWLDAEKTSPYAFYQFWLNTSDEDAKKFIKIFTLFSKEEVESMISAHEKEPHLRELQKTLAKDMTIRVHGEKEFNSAIEASEILFGKGTTETLKNLDEKTLLSVFDGVPMFEMDRNSLNEGINIIDLVAEKTNVLASKSEARRTLKENALSINKTKITEDYICTDSDLLNNKYILIQKGKKNYYLIIVK